VKSLSVLMLAVLLFAGSLFASEGKISGYMFGDYYYVASNHDKTIEGQNGFWFRRIYLTYDSGLEDNFSLRLRFEMNSAGDFSSKDKLTPVVKDAYLKWKHSSHSFMFGIQSTPTWGVVEKVWGYRSVERTALDVHKFASSRDFGFGAKGSFDSDKRLNYHFMLANGSSNGSETNDGKKVMLALSSKLGGTFILEGYADFEERPGEANRRTLQGFAGYQGKTFRGGAQFAQQERQLSGGGDDLKLRIASVFASAQISDKVWGFARVDRLLEPNPDGKKISYLPFNVSTKATFFLAGLDLRPIENVRIMPNIEAVFYDKMDGKSLDSDIIPRVTFYYTWK